MEAPVSAPLIDGEEEGDDRSFVEEAQEIASIVQRVVPSEGNDSDIVYDRWKQIVSCSHGHMEDRPVILHHAAENHESPICVTP